MWPTGQAGKSGIWQVPASDLLNEVELEEEAEEEAKESAKIA
jgi:hypothetical protein